MQDLKRCEQRLKEEKGVFDFGAMLDEAVRKSPGPDMDRASYVGPVEVRQCVVKSHGKGLFSTKDVKAGELLVVEKAFAAVFPKRKNNEERRKAEYDPVTGIRSSKSLMEMRAELGTSTYLKLHRNPSLMSGFAGLYPGPEADEEIDSKLGHAVVDDAFVQQRIIYNAFAFPILSKDFHWRVSHFEKDEAEEDEDPNGCTGMWIKASFINVSRNYLKGIRF